VIKQAIFNYTPPIVKQMSDFIRGMEVSDEDKIVVEEFKIKSYQKQIKISRDKIKQIRYGL